MGVTSNRYMQEEKERINRQKQNGVSTGGYNVTPVSAERKAAMPKVTQPQVVYTAGKQPQNYTSRYQPLMDSIMEQIQNPEAFKYEFNGDEMFKNYADLYTQYGKQAMLDTMGQAAGLTGGYGNSYAQQAGQQAYQQYLLPLYDKGMDLRNAAYQSYRDELGDLQNYYNMLQAAESADYGRYQDAMSAWQNQQSLDLAREQWEWQKALAEAAEEAGGRGGRGGERDENPGTQNTGTSFKDATNAVQKDILLNQQNLPASKLNSNLTGTVADFVKAAQDKLAAMPTTLQNKITGAANNTGSSAANKLTSSKSYLVNPTTKKKNKND